MNEYILLTSAVGALGNHAIILETSICKAFKVVFRGGWPTLFQVVTTRFGVEEELDDIGAVQFSLEVDESVVFEPFLGFLLQNVSWSYGVWIEVSGVLTRAIK
jgi:hypothetical protein